MEFPARAKASTVRFMPRTALIVSLIALMAAGCASRPTAPTVQGGGEPAPRQTKILRIGTTREPTTGLIAFATGTGALDPALTFHSSLTVYDAEGRLIPRLAESVPTIDSGDWVVDPDGGMRLTWRLRPNARWQDGTPLSVDDFILGLHFAMDSEIPVPKTPWSAAVESIQAVDGRTMTVSWKRAYFLANVGGPDELPPLPHHLLGSTYDSGNKQALINSTYWTRDFVGLGPYKIANWIPGSQLEATANDDYFLGRPKIDRLRYSFFTDTNALVAALLAGEIDYVPVGSLKVDALVSLSEQWEVTGAGSLIRSSNGLRMLLLQYRDQTAPWVSDLRVRQALVESLDRQTLVDTLQHGLTTIGHTLPTPDDPVYPLVERRGLTKYAYDPRHAQELLSQSGWTRDAQGKYQNGAGKPFSLEIRTVVTAPETLQEIVALSDVFKAAGFDSPIFQIRQGAADSSELRAKAPGAFDNYIADGPDAMRAFTGSQIATEANGWRGSNVWGYSNLGFDQMFQKYGETLSLGPRQDIQADMLKKAADELIFLPLWYYLGTTNLAVRKGVQGPGGTKSFFQCDAWNIATWDLG